MVNAAAEVVDAFRHGKRVVYDGKKLIEALGPSE